MLLDGRNPYAAGMPGVLALGWEDFRFAISERNRAALGRKAKWTVVAYLAADCDLARWMFDDLIEMKSVGSNDDVHILAVFDGPLLTDAFVARLNPGTPLADELLMRFNEVRSSDPKFLTQMLLLAQAFPAERRLVILAGHGGGWRGALVDEDGGRRYHTGRRLVLPGPGAQCDAELRRCQVAAQDELNAAIEAQNVKGAPPLDLLAFDACYTGSLEAMAELGAHARCVLVSEDQWPGEGFDYRSLLQGLQADPVVDTRELARRWVEHHDSLYRRRNARAAPITLTAFDGATIAPLAGAFVRFAQALDPRNGALLDTLHDALGATWRDEATGTADIKGLAQQLLARPVTPACAEAARALIEAYDRAVIASCGGGTPASSNGLSIYAPSPDAFDADYLRLANELPHGVGVWAWALGAYYLRRLGDDRSHPLIAALHATMQEATRAGHWRPGATT